MFGYQPTIYMPKASQLKLLIILNATDSFLQPGSKEIYQVKGYIMTSFTDTHLYVSFVHSVSKNNAII